MIKDHVDQKVMEIIYQWTDVRIQDVDANLLNPSLHISLPDWLYVFSELEKQFCVPVFCFLEETPYTEFTVNSLIQYIENQCKGR